MVLKGIFSAVFQPDLLEAKRALHFSRRLKSIRY